MSILSVPKAIGWGVPALLAVAITAQGLHAQGRDDHGRRVGGGPPGMMRGGPPSGVRGGPPSGVRGGSSRGPMSFLARLDSNGNGMLDPDEMQGRTRMMIERMAGEAKLDMSRPVPLEAIVRAFEKMRDRRIKESSGDPRSRGDDRSGHDRGRNPNDSRGVQSDPGHEPLVPGFGEPDLFDPVPGFGDMGERFAVKISDEDRQEATRTMARNDGNKDGVLDQEEIRRSRWRTDALQTDRNRDGKLTFNELALRYAMRRVQREEGSSNSRTASRGASSQSTSNSSRSSNSASQNRMVDWMFGRYDRNHNGVIEGDEMKSVRGGSERYDLNKDGKITRDELAKAMAGRFGGGGSDQRSRFFTRRDGGGDARDSGDKDSTTRSTSSTGRNSYRARTATERLANIEGLPEWFARSDANADGQVKMSEYASSWSDDVAADFAQFDLNGDGIVTPSECMKAVEQGAVQGAAPAVTANSSVDTRRASSSSGSPSRSESSTGSVSTSAGSAAKTPAPAAAAANVSQRYVSFAVKIIQRYDSNKDGVLTEDERKNMPSDFSSADTDKDGRLTPVELAAAYESQR